MPDDLDVRTAVLAREILIRAVRLCRHRSRSGGKHSNQNGKMIRAHNVREVREIWMQQAGSNPLRTETLFTAESLRTAEVHREQICFFQKRNLLLCFSANLCVLCASAVNRGDLVRKI